MRGEDLFFAEERERRRQPAQDQPSDLPWLVILADLTWVALFIVAMSSFLWTR